MCVWQNEAYSPRPRKVKKPSDRTRLPGQGRGHLLQRRSYAGFIKTEFIHVLFFNQW